MQFGGKIIKTESFEGKDAITAELDSKKMKELIEKLKLIGEIKEKEVALEAREGDIEIMMQICNDNYQYFFVNYMIRAFISYSSIDSAFADRLAIDFSSFGTKKFYGKWAIRVGDSIVQKINDALKEHDHLIIILSSNSVKSDWVIKELNLSLMRQINQKEIKIKPALIENCEIPPLLADIKYADFRNDYNVGFKELIESFQDDFDLEPFLQIVQEYRKEIELHYDQRFLAILLKRLTPISMLRLNVLSFISACEKCTDSEIIIKFGSDDFVKLQIDFLKNDGLIEMISVGGKTYYSMSKLGTQILSLILKGINEGIIGTVCSH